MNPFHLGVATMSGVEQALTAFITNKPTRVRALLFDNLGGNDVFIGKAGMDTTTLVDVVLRIPSGQTRSIGGFTHADDIDWTKYVANGTNGDMLLVTGQVVS